MRKSSNYELLAIFPYDPFWLSASPRPNFAGLRIAIFCWDGLLHLDLPSTTAVGQVGGRQTILRHDLSDLLLCRSNFRAAGLVGQRLQIRDLSLIFLVRGHSNLVWLVDYLMYTI